MRKTDQKYRTLAWPDTSPVAVLRLYKTFFDISRILSKSPDDYEVGTWCVL